MEPHKVGRDIWIRLHASDVNMFSLVNIGVNKADKAETC